MAISVHDPPLTPLNPPPLMRLVKSYYHAKFQASSSKIMAILVHDPPLKILNRPP